jgi:hypothetical protein
MEEAAAPPQLRQSRPRTHLITRTARGFQMISNRSLDVRDVAFFFFCFSCIRAFHPG